MDSHMPAHVAQKHFVASWPPFCRLAGEVWVRPAGPRLCSQTSWVFLTCFCYRLLEQVSDCFCFVVFFNLLLTRVSRFFNSGEGGTLNSALHPHVPPCYPFHNTCKGTSSKPRGFSCFSETFVDIAFWLQKHREDCKWVFKSKLWVNLLLMNLLSEIFTVMLSPRGPMSLKKSRYVTVYPAPLEFAFLHLVAFCWHTLCSSTSPEGFLERTLLPSWSSVGKDASYLICVECPLFHVCIYRRLVNTDYTEAQFFWWIPHYFISHVEMKSVQREQFNSANNPCPGTWSAPPPGTGLGTARASQIGHCFPSFWLIYTKSGPEPAAELSRDLQGVMPGNPSPCPRVLQGPALVLPNHPLHNCCWVLMVNVE